MDPKYYVALLTPDDVDILREIRLEALQNNPEAFGSSYEEEAVYSDANLKEQLTKAKTFGLFYDNKIIGQVNFGVLPIKRTLHDGYLTGMYVTPSHRDKGIGSILLQAVIKYAQDKVIQLHLECISENKGVIKFYEKHGFVTFGTHPRALKDGDKFYDTNFMFLKLD